MKKLSYLFVAGLILLISCKKSGNDSTSNGFPQSAETKPQYDNTSLGVYKGVVVGSTGTIIIKINNGDNIVKAYLSITNSKDTLSTSQQVVLGQAITNLKFTGRISSFNLIAKSNGDSAEIANLTISGHPGATAIVIHENSNQQVFCYEGTFTGGRSGNICFMQTGKPYDNTTGQYLMRYLAKTSDNLILMGRGLYDMTSDTARNTHYFTGENVPPVPYVYFAGKGKFEGSSFDRFSGYWTSYTHPAGVAHRGDFSCSRTY